MDKGGGAAVRPLSAPPTIFLIGNRMVMMMKVLTYSLSLRCEASLSSQCSMLNAMAPSKLQRLQGLHCLALNRVHLLCDILDDIDDDNDQEDNTNDDDDAEDNSNDDDDDAAGDKGSGEEGLAHPPHNH